MTSCFLLPRSSFRLCIEIVRYPLPTFYCDETFQNLRHSCPADPFDAGFAVAQTGFGLIRRSGNSPLGLSTSRKTG
jgi:hypothetical protein